MDVTRLSLCTTNCCFPFVAIEPCTGVCSSSNAFFLLVKPSFVPEPAMVHDTAIATVEVDLVVPDVLVTVETSNLRGGTPFLP